MRKDQMLSEYLAELQALLAEAGDVPVKANSGAASGGLIAPKVPRVLHEHAVRRNTIWCDDRHDPATRGLKFVRI
jgi:hypothetical protein